MSLRLQTSKSTSINGKINVPGDKSISHRAVLLGAMGEGPCQVSGLLESEDVLCTIAAMRALGAKISESTIGDEKSWLIEGVGVGGFQEPAHALDFGNSGTGARLVMGAIATTPITVLMEGDASLSGRPMDRVLGPLEQMGMQTLSARNGRLPLCLRGAAYPVPITYKLPMASAQVKSAILLAALNVPGRTSVIEPKATRDHTERMFEGMGIKLDIEKHGNGGSSISLEGPCRLKTIDVAVPGDPSSAAFLVAAALLVPKSELLIENVLVNDTRIGFYKTVQEMGGDLTFQNMKISAGEEVADILVRSSELNGITVPAERAPSMIDEYPILSVLSAFAKGSTHMQGLAELRVKESDRLAAMGRGLAACGVEVEEGEDYLIVQGGKEVSGGVEIDTELDHRIAMSFAVLGLRGNSPIIVNDADMIATSFPHFVPLMKALGAQLEELE